MQTPWNSHSWAYVHNHEAFSINDLFAVNLTIRECSYDAAFYMPTLGCEMRNKIPEHY